MNKYDDIKRFIEKTNTKSIDYKEINENPIGDGMTGSMNKWALIKQVSASEETPGILENGRTTQSTPQAISVEEFQRSAPVVHVPLNTPVSVHSTTSHVPTPLNASPSSIPLVSGDLMEALRESLPVTPTPQFSPQASELQSTAMRHAQSVTSDSAGSLLDAVNNALPAQQATPASEPVYTAPAGQFRQMFKQKAPPCAAAFLHRDTPLQPLLEIIASCH